MKTLSAAALALVVALAAGVGWLAPGGLVAGAQTDPAPTPTSVSMAFLPYVRRDPTPLPPPTATPYWWEERCGDGRAEHVIWNGGFEDETLFPWGWTRELSSTAPEKSFDGPRAGAASLLFPGRHDRIGIGRTVHAVPLVGYARPGERGPQLRAARLRYWFKTVHETPIDGTRDYVGVEMWGCAYRDDGDVVVYDRVDVLDFENPSNDRRGEWLYTENDVTNQMRYYGGGRRCVGLIGISEDDGTPADIYFDEVTLEICTDP